MTKPSLITLSALALAADISASVAASASATANGITAACAPLADTGAGGHDPAPVAGEEHRARVGLPAEQGVAAEGAVAHGREPGEGAVGAAREQRRVRARVVAQRVARERHVLPHDAHEHRARHLVLQLDARDVPERDHAAVPRAREALLLVLQHGVLSAIKESS